MGRLTLRLPDALHTQLETLARSEGVSLNQYLVYALTRQATLDAQALEKRGDGRQKTNKTVTRKDQAASLPGENGEFAPGEQEAAGDLRRLTDDIFPPSSGD